MGRIFYLMGKSSSGKDTIYKHLMAKPALGLLPIVQYTTRPIRSEETEGVEYHFVTEEELDELDQQGKLIESRAYHTWLGLWIYATVSDESIDLEHHDYLVIGTLESFLKVQSYFGSDKVLPIMIECDDGVRLQRALDRERSQEEPKYGEMCRRFLADEQDFAPEKKAGAGISRVFENDVLEECIEKICSFIEANR